MEFEKLDKLFSSSNTVRLIRANHAPLILSFLYKEFKIPHRLYIPHIELVHKLSDYLVYIKFEEEYGLDKEENLDIETRSKRLLDTWTEQNFLRKYPDEHGEHLHELTSDTEKAINWVESIHKKEFVGTESRFKNIFNKLKELVENSTADPVEKIKELEAKKKDIEEEIRQIKITQNVITYNETQIKERFYEINKISRELLADFKEVEQNFKDIIRNIYQKQSEKHSTKGSIVGYALDALEDLKQKDQGRSFYAFWEFLIADKSQEELNGLIATVYDILEQKEIRVENDRFLRRIKINLYQAGKKVIESNRQLSAKLSKILSERDMLERKKTIELIAEIRHDALRVINNPPKEDDFLYIDGYPELNLVMQRPLGEPPQEASLKNQPSEIAGIELKDINVDSLFSQFSINKVQLNQNITDLLKDKPQVSLAEVLQKHPVQKGLAEILTYFQIASQSNKHLISETVIDTLELGKYSDKYIKIPQVIYTK